MDNEEENKSNISKYNSLVNNVEKAIVNRHIDNIGDNALDEEEFIKYTGIDVKYTKYVTKILDKWEAEMLSEKTKLQRLILLDELLNTRTSETEENGVVIPALSISRILKIALNGFNMEEFSEFHSIFTSYNEMVNFKPLAVTSMHKCKSCKSSAVQEQLLQTRSSDEGVTSYFNCMSCGLQWKFNN